MNQCLRESGVSALANLKCKIVSGCQTFYGIPSMSAAKIVGGLLYRQFEDVPVRSLIYSATHFSSSM